jgi:hypothetical protein
MHAMLLSVSMATGPNSSASFARRGTPQQVHLEVAFLRMHVAERAHRVVLVGGIDGDDAEGVAVDGDRCRQPGKRQLPLQRRQAATQQPPKRSRTRPAIPATTPTGCV